MKDKISALMDGELDEKSAGEMIEALGREGEALQTWRSYHLIGDALRETLPLTAGFTARVAGRLALEPTILAPQRSRAERKWVALSAAASVAAVALVGWLAFAPPQAPAPVAQAPGVRALAESKPALVPLPNGTNDYLLAHQGFSPRAFIPGIAPYARTVSEQANERK